ncbi:hypothetical protein [Spirosoma litoris]
MKNVSFITLFVLSVSAQAFSQRQELTISPTGIFYPSYQLVQYERYLNTRQSLTISLGYNGNDTQKRAYGLISPPRTDVFTNTRLAIGYRYYIPGLGIGDALTLFSSARMVVDYSNLQLQPDATYPMPTDSLRAAGFSLAPELLFGGKATIAKRITLSGAIGAQYLVKLFSTNQITHNPGYWDSVYWKNDRQDWQQKRNVATHFRQGWFPSIQFTVGVILGKHATSGSSR